MNVGASVRKFFSNTNFLLFVNLFLLVCFFSQLEKINIGHFFNADSLYLPSVYRDLFVDKNSFEGWHLNPAPNFFPDMFFYCILMFLCGNNFIIASFLFSIIQYFVFLFILRALFKIIVPDQSAKFHAVIFFIPTLCLLSAFYLHGNYIFAYFLLSNSYHTGSFIMALVSFILTLSFFKEGYISRAVILFIIAFVAVFSDKLYIASFVAPAIFTSLFFIKKYTRVSLTVISISIVAPAISLWLFNKLSRSNYLWFDDVQVAEIKMENIAKSYHRMVELLKEFIFYFGYHTLTIYLFLTSIFLLLFLLIKRWKNSAPVLKYSLIFIICQSALVVIAPIVSGKFTGEDTFRYNLYPVYLGGLNLAIFLAITVPRKNFVKTGFKYAMFLSIISAFIGGIYKFESKGLIYFFSFYPETARKLDAIAEKDGLLRGVGNYWYAKYVTMFSKRGVKVHAVFDDLVAYTHVANENWFFDQNHKFNFVLLNNFGDTSLYRKNVTNAKLIYNETDFMVVKTNIFVYEKSNYLPKN